MTKPFFYGHVVSIRDTITFQACDAAGLQQAFRDSVDDYLEFATAVERGIADADTGRVITHEELMDRLDHILDEHTPLP